MSLLELAFENKDDSLSVRHFAVREPISGLFDVAIMARSRTVDLDIESFVGRPAAFLMMGGPLSGPRAWSGVATHFQLVQSEPTGLSTYYVRIAPQMYLLRLRKRNRIFQHLTIPVIVQKILQEYSIVHKMQTVDVHQEHEYRVQYEESDFDFINRLCEEEGISYYFKQVDMGTQYTSEMILTDKPESREDRPTLPFVYTPNQDARKEFVRHVKIAHRVRPGAAEFRDYDYVRPDFQLIGDAEKAKKPEDFYELYKYDPAALVKDRRGKPRVPADHEGELVASIDLASSRRGKRLLTFESNAYDLGPGVTFRIDKHPREDITAGHARFLCTDVYIEGTHDGEWSLSGVAAFDEERAKTRFRPAKNTVKPSIEGVESAIVVGPKGEEIHTDEFGRVRVQFHWDRDGQYDDKSSCWIRVSQAWAGGAFGMIVLPRVGQEVLVGFLEGDPDQPILVGRAYNKVAPVPFVLPDQKTVSTWKSQSSPKAEGWNEITFDDAASKELMYIQAQRNLSKLVKANENERTGVNRTIIVGANRSSFIGKTDSYMIGKRHVAAVMPPKKIDVTKSEDPEIPPMKTMMETIHPKITHTTSKATSTIDNKDIVLLADRNIVFKSGGDVIIEGKHVYINTKGVGGGAPKVNAGASDGARKIAGRTILAVKDVFGQPKAQSIRLAMQRQLIGFRPPTPHQIRVAGMPGSSVEQVIARAKVALEFYKNMGRTWDDTIKQMRPYKYPEELREIMSHLTGIDFRQPLHVGPPPPAPAELSQWQAPDKHKGQYFAAAYTDPLTLGIGKFGENAKNEIKEKISKDFSIPADTPYLRSIASAKTDFWSIDEKHHKDNIQKTKGGGTQFYMGDNTRINFLRDTPPKPSPSP